jgi:hypothetical protein
MKNTGYGARTSKSLDGTLDTKRCRELGDKYIEASGGYTAAEMVFTLRQLADMVEKHVGGISFERVETRAKGGHGQ